MISIEIGIQNIGVDAGPFDLYSDVDNFTTAFETGITKTEMEQGFISNSAPDNSTIIRVQSTGDCDNFLDIPIEAQPTTTTSTTTTTLPPTTTTLPPTTSTTTLPPTTSTTTSTTTLPPTTTTTTSTTLPPTTTTTTTSTTTLNRELTITNVTFDGQYLVFFESNFNLTLLAYETSINNGSSWSTPTTIGVSGPQEFIPVLNFGSFLIRLFDNDSVIITYSNEYLYTAPTTTSTTTTLPPGNFVIGVRSSDSSSTSGQIICGFNLATSCIIYTDNFIDQTSVPTVGDIVLNSNNLNDRFDGQNRWWNLGYSTASGVSVVARISGDVNNRGVVLSVAESCFTNPN